MGYKEELSPGLSREVLKKEASELKFKGSIVDEHVAEKDILEDGRGRKKIFKRVQVESLTEQTL